MRITLEEVNRIKEAMKLLPPSENKNEKLTKSRAIKLMESEIKNLRKLGYTFQQISEFLSNNGFSVKPSTVNISLRAEKKRRIKTQKLETKIELA